MKKSGVTKIIAKSKKRPVCRAVTRSSLEREVLGSILRPVKSDILLLTARHRSDISSKEAVLHTGAMTRRWAPQTRYTLRRSTASIMKDLICQIKKIQLEKIKNFELRFVRIFHKSR